MPISITGDMLLVYWFFVLGGDFRDMPRNLFVHDAVVQVRPLKSIRYNLFSNVRNSKMAQNQIETVYVDRHVRQLHRLERLMDVIFAIVIWRIFMLLPRPETGTLDWKSLYAFLFSNRIDLLMIIVGIAVVIIYWSQNNTLFGNLERTDGRHTVIAILQVFSLLLFLYAMRMGTFFDGTREARIFESLTASLVGLTAVTGWYYAIKKGLISDTLSDNEARHILDRILAEPICALLTIPCAFIGPVIWEIAWLSFIPVAQIIKRVRKR